MGGCSEPNANARASSVCTGNRNHSHSRLWPETGMAPNENFWRAARSR